jgi:hypothetical protein
VTPSPAPPDSHRFLDWLALGHFANAILTGLAALAVILHPVFHWGGGLAALAPFLALACVLLATLDWWTGLCLRRRQGRGFCLLVSALNCLCLPGVLVGLPTLAVLSRPAVAQAFAEPKEH